MKYQNLLGGIVSILLCGCSSTSSSHWAEPDDGSGWPTHPIHTENHSLLPSDPTQPVSILWKRNVHADISSPVAISPYNLVSFTTDASHGCSFYTLEITSGRKDFCRALNSTNAQNSPLTDRYGNIYTGNSDAFFAYDWYGPLRWKTPVVGTPLSSIFVQPNVVLTLTDQGFVYLFDAHLGTLLAQLHIRLEDPEEFFNNRIFFDPSHSHIWLSTSNRVYQLHIHPIFPHKKPIDINQFPQLNPIEYSTDTTDQISIIQQYVTSAIIKSVEFSPDFLTMYLLTNQGIDAIDTKNFQQKKWSLLDDTLQTMTINFPHTLIVTGTNSIENIDFSTKNLTHDPASTLPIPAIIWRAPLTTTLSPPLLLSNNKVIALVAHGSNDPDQKLKNTATDTIFLIKLNTFTGKIISRTPLEPFQPQMDNHVNLNVTSHNIIIASFAKGILMGLTN